MNKRLVLLLTALTLSLAAPAARANVSVEVFYESLDPYGEWVEVGDYGYCWAPRDVGSDWRPYTDGEWAYTDAGWTWISDEPYGWAVYHYGRWLRTESIGWVWVPGEEWGPAWVSWRRSPEYVGWAPLPPEARFSRSAGFSLNVDVQFDIGPASYSFVPVRQLGAQRLRTVILEPQRNITIIRETRNITNITYVNQTVINRGPDYDEIVEVSERPIRRLKLDRRTDFAGAASGIEGGAQITGETLSLPAPRIEKKAGAKPKKVARNIENAKVQRGWEGAGSPEEVETLRAEMKKEKPEPAAAKGDKKDDRKRADDAPATTEPAAAVESQSGKEPKAAKKSAREKQPQTAPPVPEPAPVESKPDKPVREPKTDEKAPDPEMESPRSKEPKAAKKSEREKEAQPAPPVPQPANEESKPEKRAPERKTDETGPEPARSEEPAKKSKRPEKAPKEEQKPEPPAPPATKTERKRPAPPVETPEPPKAEKSKQPKADRKPKEQPPQPPAEVSPQPPPPSAGPAPSSEEPPPGADSGKDEAKGKKGKDKNK